jgi:hypothetical protein
VALGVAEEIFQQERVLQAMAGGPVLTKRLSELREIRRIAKASAEAINCGDTWVSGVRSLRAGACTRRLSQ